MALALYVALGRNRSFYRDDWDFIVARRASDVGDLLRPHNEHWSTLPILVYRVLFHLFGLRTYVPYQLLAIVLHLTAAALLLVIIRRAGVDPWLATAAASLFALFGAGAENIVWAFQMAWQASLVLGLTHLLLADHDGPLDRRDWLGLLAGLLGLLCSGVAVTMVVVVGLAALVRRGWRVAAFHTAPLAVVYGLWWIVEARDEYSTHSGGLGKLTRFVADGVAATFDALGQLPRAGIVFGLLLVVGLALTRHDLDRTVLRTRMAAPGAMLVGAVVFCIVSGMGRAGLLAGAPFPSRYLHLVAALVLPSLAVAADAIARRWPVALPALFVVLLIGVPGNVDALVDDDRRAAALPLAVLPVLPRPVRTQGADGRVPDRRQDAASSPPGWADTRDARRVGQGLRSRLPRLPLRAVRPRRGEHLHRTARTVAAGVGAW